MKYRLNEVIDLILAEGTKELAQSIATIIKDPNIKGDIVDSLRNEVKMKGEISPESLNKLLNLHKLDKQGKPTDKKALPKKIADAIETNELEEKKEILYEFSEKVEKSLRNKAKKTGKSLATIKAVYRRGLAAWKSGHRPGVPQHQWGMGRVNSFLTGVGGARKADSDLYKKSKKKKLKEEEQADPGFKKLQDEIKQGKLVFIDPSTNEKVVIKTFDQLAKILDDFAKADLIMQAVTRPSANENKK